MAFTIVIKIFDDMQLQKGEVYFSQNYFQEIRDNFPQIDTLTLPEVKDAFLIYAKGVDFHKPAKKAEIKSIEKSDKYLKITFNNTQDIDLTTDLIRRRLYNRLNQEHILKNIKNLPNCCILNEDQSSFVLRQKTEFQGSLIEELRKMEQSSDWLGIYNRYKSIEAKEKLTEIWNDGELLSVFGFAAGKLAETSEIPKSIFKDESQKKLFLKKQSQLRKETEAIRKRFIELNPGNPTGYSNLGYYHYQNSIELSAPKGRRDGNLLEEIDKALEYIDQALKIDCSRITDLYRKGHLLADVKPRVILFGKQKDNTEPKDLAKLAMNSRTEGIKTLLLAVKYWENLDISNKKKNDEKNRTRSSYIRSLYNLGNAYFDCISNDWDDSVFLLALKDSIKGNEKITYITSDLENINKSIENFQKCSLADFRGAESQNDLVSISSLDGVFEAVNKLYSIGKALFTKYWILSGYGQKDTPESIDARDLAKIYLEEALKCPWPKEKSRQNKHFIAERLARLFISSGDYESAISIIINNCGSELSRVQAFILNTLSLAYTLKKDFCNAHLALENAAVSKTNIAVWQSYFITGCVFLREGMLEEASNYFNKADNEARRTGKQNVDSFLIAQAFVSYKSGEKAKAVEFLQSAYSLNPYRMFVTKKLQQWQINK